MDTLPSHLAYALAGARTTFGACRKGNAAILFGLSLLPMALGIGGAIDYSRATASKTALQAALDAAVLAGALAPEANRNDIAAKTLAANFSSPGASVPTATWTTNADGSFSGTAASQQSTSFMQIVRINAMEVGAQATAMRRGGGAPNKLTFQLDYASGWYWKRVTLWSHKPGDSADTQIASFVYQPSDLTTASWRGSGQVTGPLNQTIDIGSNYDKLYLKMEISDDGCGPGYVPKVPFSAIMSKPDEARNFTCNAVKSGERKTGTITTVRTDDPRTSHYLFVGGQQLPANAAAKALDLVKCGKSLTHTWEDGGAWWAQDIGFTVTSTSCAQNTALNGGGGGGVALIR